MNFIHESSSPKLYIKSNISFSLLSLQISGKFDKVFDVADISVYVRFGSKIWLTPYTIAQIRNIIQRCMCSLHRQEV